MPTSSASALHLIIYMSRSLHPMSDEALRTLLQQARQANEQQQVTGVLVYGAGQFMQVIEGEQAVLEALYAKLLTDGRHHNVVKLADKQVESRSFGEWSMGFQPVSDQNFARLLGYVEPAKLELQAPNLSAADALLLQMMKVFVLTPPEK